jgi:CheY-like chemotaxis protein
MVSRQLKLWGLNVELCSDNAEVKSLYGKIEKNNFSVLLVDETIDSLLIENIFISLANANKSQLNKTQVIFLTTMNNDSANKSTLLTSLMAKENVHRLTKPIVTKSLHRELTLTFSSKNRKPELRSVTKLFASQTVAESDNEHVKILLVEDNRINQEVALGLLRKMGYKADVAKNGLHALELLEKRQLSKPYQLVLMDCQMPEMDGYQATVAIRSEDKYQLSRQINIIAMTANTMKGDQEKCLAAGMNDYLAKPINPSLLAEKIAFWLAN